MEFVVDARVTRGHERFEAFGVLKEHLTTTHPHCVQREIDSGTVPVSLRIPSNLRRKFPSKQPQEQILKHIFGILVTARHVIGRAVDELGVLLKNLVEFRF